VTPNPRRITSLEFKPDFAGAVRRWEAYLAGEIIDRPLVCVTAPKPGMPHVTPTTYYERVHGSVDEVVDRALRAAAATYWGGEAIPSFWGSFGCDEVAVFCGGQFEWKEGAGDTCWSIPFLSDWDRPLPLRLDENHPLWRRMLAMFRKAAERMAGKMVMNHIDLHTNMDLLAAARGPQALCLDLLDRPEAIDRAMMSARAVFPTVWRRIAEAGRMDELGYGGGMFSHEGAAVLQCDFSCMISPGMFKRWVVPALEEEAALVRHACYHWDGLGALIHTDAILATHGLHTLGFVPGAGHGAQIEYVDLYKKWQRAGKAVWVGGSIDEIKRMHRELDPARTMYSAWTDTPAEAEQLLEWFVKNT